MLQPKSSLLTLAVKKSCKTSYEWTQTRNESTQAEFFPWLSRPRSWPVRTRNEWIKGKLEMNQRKVWMSQLNQEFPELSRPVPTRGNKVQRKKENESTWRVNDSTHSSFPELSRPMSRPVRTRGVCAESWVESQSKNTQKCIFAMYYAFFAPFFVCNEYFGDGNERKWPIEYMNMTINPNSRSITNTWKRGTWPYGPSSSGMTMI